MIYEIYLSSAAVADIKDASDWYEKQRPGLGYEFEMSVGAAITFLESNPLLCQKSYRNIRVKYTKRFPYGIHYEMAEKSVKIIAVFHMKRNPRRWNERKFQ